jgi:hypothetical protein
MAPFFILYQVFRPAEIHSTVDAASYGEEALLPVPALSRVLYKMILPMARAAVPIARTPAIRFFHSPVRGGPAVQAPEGGLVDLRQARDFKYLFFPAGP